MRIRFRILMLIAAVLILAAVTGRTQSADPNQPDSVVLDSVVVFTAGGAVVPVYFLNDEDLGGIEITLAGSSPDVAIDSFSFVGGRAETVSVKGWTLNDEYLTIYCIPFSTDPLISPGRGLLGNLYISYPPSVPTQVVALETQDLIVGDLIYSTTFSSASSAPFVPQFGKGYLDLRVSNCCIGIRGNVNADPEEKVNISDVTFLVKYLFGIPPGPPPLCDEEGNANADFDGKVNISDLTYLTTYLFGGGPPPTSCP